MPEVSYKEERVTVNLVTPEEGGGVKANPKKEVMHANIMLYFRYQ